LQTATSTELIKSQQDFAAALEFAHELRQAKDVQDFVRIQSEYSQKCFQSLAAQMRDFAETYANVASGAIKAPSLYSLELLADEARRKQPAFRPDAIEMTTIFALVKFCMVRF
jgi:hypothetical protein